MVRLYTINISIILKIILLICNCFHKSLLPNTHTYKGRKSSSAYTFRLTLEGRIPISGYCKPINKIVIRKKCLALNFIKALNESHNLINIHYLEYIIAQESGFRLRAPSVDNRLLPITVCRTRAHGGTHGGLANHEALNQAGSVQFTLVSLENGVKYTNQINYFWNKKHFKLFS